MALTPTPFGRLVFAGLFATLGGFVAVAVLVFILGEAEAKSALPGDLLVPLSFMAGAGATLYGFFGRRQSVGVSRRRRFSTVFDRTEDELEPPGPEPIAQDPPVDDPPVPVDGLREQLLTRQDPNRFAPLILAGLFVAWAYQAHGAVLPVAVTVAVLLVHELGHFVAMRVFGYGDVRIFFLPGLGAVTTGQRTGAARWNEGVVLLAGPLPGLLVGSLLLTRRPLGEVAGLVATQALFINALNLLPLAGLDGGRLVQLVLFSRRRRLERPFVWLTSAILLYFAYQTSNWAIALFTAFGVRASGTQHKLAIKGDRLREKRGEPYGPIETLSDNELRELRAGVFAALEEVTLADLPAHVTTLHDHASAEPVGVVSGRLLLATYVGSLVSVVGIAIHLLGSAL